MRHARDSGFTLVEVMIVLVIIGICAAIVGPQLVDHKRSRDLTDLVNVVQQTASQARSLALQTRHAAVLEVSGTEGKIWVNTLTGPRCWDGISQRCMQTAGHMNGEQEFDFNEEPYTSAGTALCDVSVSVVTGEGTESPSCDLVSSVTEATDFALCYSGDGVLYARDGADPAAACEGSGDAAGIAAWARVCYPEGSSVSGATLKFNRFESGGSGQCGDGGVGDVIDVTRTVVFPAGGAPYSKVM